LQRQLDGCCVDNTEQQVDVDLGLEAPRHL
jgi:hypothetical protein